MNKSEIILNIFSDDDLCASLYEKFKGGRTYASLALEVGQQYGEEIHTDRLRSGLRRYLARRSDDELAELDAPQDYVFDLPQQILQSGVMNLQDDTEALFPQPQRITEVDVLVLEDPNVLIVGDIHAPYHSPQMLERAVHITHKYFPHITNCMIIGDLFDFSAISSHSNDQPTTSTETDIRAGGKIARSLRGAFNALYIGKGNHDGRMSSKLNSEFSMTSLLCGALGNQDPGLFLTDLDYMYIGDEIIAGHPTMYSAQPTKIASKIALKQRKNVITGHSHKIGITMSDDGEHWSIDNGHCATEDLFFYAKRRMNTFGKSGAGFTIISNNRPFIFGELITDWEFWR